MSDWTQQVSTGGSQPPVVPTPVSPSAAADVSSVFGTSCARGFGPGEPGQRPGGRRRPQRVGGTRACRRGAREGPGSGPAGHGGRCRPGDRAEGSARAPGDRDGADADRRDHRRGRGSPGRRGVVVHSPTRGSGSGRTRDRTRERRNGGRARVGPGAGGGFPAGPRGGDRAGEPARARERAGAQGG